MTVLPENVRWGSYKTYEGPYYRGSIKFKLPEVLTEADRRLRVLTATEGGTFDAVNMYDRCIISVGLIQWCEARYYLVSKLLHSVIEDVGVDVVVGPLRPALESCHAEFKKNSRGNWRFFFKDERGEVDTLKKQQELFLGCDGRKGSWSEDLKSRARLWASCMANIWKDPRAQRSQALYTAARLTSFLMKEGREILWDDTPDIGWPGALRAAYLSYAGNLPAVANKHVQIASARLKSPKWSKNWCIGVLQELAYGPNIKIYLHRYNVIRPWLEELWDGVELPKTAADLKTWSEPDPEPKVDTTLISEGVDVSSEVGQSEPTTKEPTDVTTALPRKEETSVTLREPTVPTIKPSVETPKGVLGWILHVLYSIMNFFLRKKDDK